MIEYVSLRLKLLTLTIKPQHTNNARDTLELWIISYAAAPTSLRFKFQNTDKL